MDILDNLEKKMDKQLENSGEIKKELVEVKDKLNTRIKKVGLEENKREVNDV